MNQNYQSIDILRLSWTQQCPIFLILKTVGFFVRDVFSIYLFSLVYIHKQPNNNIFGHILLASSGRINVILLSEISMFYRDVFFFVFVG